MLKLLCGLLTAVFFLAWAPVSRADDEANAIVEKAIKAHGGAANLAKLLVRQEKTKGSFGPDATITGVFLYQLPERMKGTTVSEGMGETHTNISVNNGDESWRSYNGKVLEMPAEMLKQMKGKRQNLDYVLTLAPILKDRSLTTASLGVIKVNDQPALGVKVSSKGYPDVDLYFDKETGLLVQSGGRSKDRTGEFNVEVVYSDYKVTDGLKWPMKCVRFHDGKRFGDREITELKFLDKIDVSEFTKR
jgi:hypothetical protein